MKIHMLQFYTKTENLEITKKENKLITFSIIFGKRVLLLMQINISKT